MGNDAPLVFDGITKSFGAHRVLEQVSLHVEAGEVFGLLGPNGAGKTTLIRLALDILRPDAGSVQLWGRNPADADLDRIAYLPEERGLYRRERVIDVLIYLARLKGLAPRLARTRARAWLGRVGLESTERWRIDRLSKGMAQKLQIAATLVSDPDLVILDEPFSGLDPVNVQLIVGIIRERRDAGLATVLSAHQMGLVESLCDRVALMHGGRRVVYGTVGDIRRAHGRPTVVVELAGGRGPPACDGIESWQLLPSGRQRIVPRPGQRPADLLPLLIAAGAPVEHFEVVLPTIEDVFVDTVGGLPTAGTSTVGQHGASGSRSAP